MKKLMIVALLATLVLTSGVAYAKLVSGTVVSSDAAANTLTISNINAETGTSENVTIWVNEKTTYSGVDALATLTAGDEVWVDAEEDAATQNWIATSVQRVEAPAAPAATETAAQ